MAVVITSIKVRSPLGCTLEECMNNIELGKRCISNIENFNTAGFQTTAAGEIRCNGKVVTTEPNIDRKNFFLDQITTELRNSTSFDKKYNPTEIAMNIGSGLDYVDIENLYKKREFTYPKTAHLPSHYKSNKQITEIATKNNIKGGCNVFVAACAASTQAIGLSYKMVKSRIREAVITGGADSMVNQINYLGFYHLGAMATAKEGEAPYICKPFDKNRSGTILGEGAIVMLLENSKNAKKENIIAQIAGYASTMDAYAVTDPDPSAKSLARAISNALKSASITPEMIDCVHLHGTGTYKNAPAEYNALAQIFKERVKELPVYSLKGQIGHMIGSCGAMEMLGVIYSIQNQVVLPTINFSEQDPEAPLYVIKEKPLHIPINYILKLNSSFGGENSALIIKKYD